MLTYAIVLFTFTAIAGLILATKVLKGKMASWPVSIIHALAGAAGLVILVIAVLKGTSPAQVTAALGLLVVAALGGFFLASLHIREKIAPKSVVIIHAAVAVAGFLTLASAVLSF